MNENGLKFKDFMKKVIKLTATILYFFLTYILISEFLKVNDNPDGLYINFLLVLLTMPLAIFSCIYGIISLISIFKNKIKITIVDKIFLIFMSIVIIFAFIRILIYN